ncbi:maestro heat-like repeat-containing protein family member 7 [Chiroxiphia lanceolata]|uniref:maestro heat-like repeat-containing protein family member 7 n=1 Tax=Chiroxiphia lanceolata TaxID=296741 RepID=UPI0013CE4426|nr:maestro heat-like repeat-containing protein family member 7 [Chiroxiphia lanceolata]
MWKTLISSRGTKELVLQILFRVLEYWPAHRRRTSDGDERDVFALAATVALWEILQLSWCPGAVKDNFPRLLLTLLFQVFISTEEMSEQVETFWRRCREQRSLPPNPNRFAVQTIKALLRQLLDEDVLMVIGRKCGWDMLLKADSHHYAVGLLARELCRVSRSFCRSIAVSLLPRLSRGEPLWELPALAFLVEVLHCLNPRQCGPSVLQIISRCLRSQCPERCRLALRGLVVLSKAPAMAKSIWSLNESLLELLQDADSDVVEMTLSAFINVLHLKTIQISSPTALKLLEALRPLFDNEHSQLQQLSMLLFREVMEATERSKSLKPHVYLSLVPFYFNWHDENQRVAEASRRALFGAARLLKWRDLEHLVTMEQPWRFPECLLEKDRSRVGQYVRQALPYLESPEEPLRKLAIKFLGIAARSMKQEQPELQLICQAEAGAVGNPEHLVFGDGHKPSPSQEAASVSCLCVAGWIAPGSQVPLERLLWSSFRAAPLPGRAAATTGRALGSSGRPAHSLLPKRLCAPQTTAPEAAQEQQHPQRLGLLTQLQLQPDILTDFNGPA